MASNRMPVHVSHNVSTSTITVTLPFVKGREFPSVTRFTMSPRAVDVRVIHAEGDSIGFVLTLNTVMPEECRRQLDRIFTDRTARRIMNLSEGRHLTIEIIGSAFTNAFCALRHAAKFPPKQNGSPSSVPIEEEAVGQNVIKRRNAQKILTSLADEKGRISATRLPRPDPRRLLSVR